MTKISVNFQGMVGGDTNAELTQNSIPYIKPTEELIANIIASVE